MNRRHRRSERTWAIVEALSVVGEALVDVAAFIFTVGYIDHITRGPCRHCHR